MAKKHKIKRYYRMGSVYKARPHPLTVFLSIVVIAALVFVGISIYDPVYNLIMGKIEPDPPPASEPEFVSVPEESTPEEPVGEEPGHPELSVQSMVFMPVETAADPDARTAFFDAVKAYGADTVLLDVKDSQGYVLHRTGVQEALDWGAVAADAFDLRAVARELEERDLRLAVRITAFRDPLAPQGDRGNGVRYQNGEWLWYDAQPAAGGKPWLNPYAAGARAYVTSLARESVQLGAAFVLLEDVRFPDGSLNSNATFGAQADGVTRAEILARFVGEVQAAVEAAGGRAGVYLPAIAATQANYNETRYGGNPFTVLGDTISVGLLPYQFGTGYAAEGLEIIQPDVYPLTAVRAALAYIQGITGSDTTLIPLLQGGTESGSAPITREVLDGQIEAVTEAGCTQYILHQTAGQYAFSD